MRHVRHVRFGWRLPLFTLLLMSVLYCAVFYARYAGSAWFFQDDFMFLREYEQELYADQWMSAANFGRFLSRNLYWWGGWRLFGANAQAYFLFNLACMAATSMLLLCLCLRHSLALGVLLATAYWTAGATVSNLSWLSNSQHLLAHTLMALYFCLAYHAWQQQRSLLLIVSGFVYALALSANVLSAVAMSLPAILLCVRPRGRFAAMSLVMLVVQLCLALWVVITVKPDAGSPYAMSWTVPVVRQNIAFYFGHPAAFFALAALLSGFAWMRFRAGDALEAWLLLAGPAFIVPFLPLAEQRYMNYAAFSHAFTLLGVCLCAYRAQDGRSRMFCSCVVVVVLLAFVTQTQRQMAYFKHERRGAAQREQIRDLNDIVRAEGVPAGSTLCFSQHGELHVEGRPLPGFWWGVGFGQAFQKFASDRYDYKLMSERLSCTYQIRVDGARLYIYR